MRDIRRLPVKWGSFAQWTSDAAHLRSDGLHRLAAHPSGAGRCGSQHRWMSGAATAAATFASASATTCSPPTTSAATAAAAAASSVAIFGRLCAVNKAVRRRCSSHPRLCNWPPGEEAEMEADANNCYG